MTLTTDKTKKQFEELVDLIKKGDYFEYKEALNQFPDINYQIQFKIFIIFYFFLFLIEFLLLLMTF